MISIEMIHERLTGGKANLHYPVRNHQKILDGAEVFRTTREALKK